MTSSQEPSIALRPTENLLADAGPRLAVGESSVSNGAPNDLGGRDSKGLCPNACDDCLDPGRRSKDNLALGKDCTCLSDERPVDGREFRPGLPCQKVVSSSSGTSANSGGTLEWGSGLSC